ncbi:hypothetical protein FN846DRAFT_907129 [Sphaerosporella brunnea]|uniref:Uncharacterized protein n=1 Tax=Sphaerosporella brunnea TaxID=1250544 RepID=A0A5J5EX29_9PEZI|nr:hypothetical protein FN846DRAFT_907129 [Sphaerosporella brunnea]
MLKDSAAAHVTGGTVDLIRVLSDFTRSSSADEKSAESPTAIDVCHIGWCGRRTMRNSWSKPAILGAQYSQKNTAGAMRTLPRTLGMMVPQSILLKQIAQATGWEKKQDVLWKADGEATPREGNIARRRNKIPTPIKVLLARDRCTKAVLDFLACTKGATWSEKTRM